MKLLDELRRDLRYRECSNGMKICASCEADVTALVQSFQGKSVESEKTKSNMNYIDTSTTEGKIAVMQAAMRGERIQLFNIPCEDGWVDIDSPSWDWEHYNYRIAPKPAARQPLGPADFPPGTVCREILADGTCALGWWGVIRVAEEYLQLGYHQGVTHFDSPTFMKYFERSLDGGKTWLPCYK